MINIIKTEEFNSNNPFQIVELGKDVYQITGSGKSEIIEVLETNLESKSIVIRHQHSIYEIAYKNQLDEILDKIGMKSDSEGQKPVIKAPMPGKVIQLIVDPGATVNKGDAILILEAMKMENVLKAESQGIIKNILVNERDNVEKNQILVEFELTD